MHQVEALVDVLSFSVWVIIGSISILPSMYQSTIFGTSVRPRAPPKAVPFQVRPVTSWNGRVEISCAGAGHADDDRLAPAAMRAFQRLAHHLGVAGAVEGVVRAADLVGAALGHVDEMGTTMSPSISFGLTKWVMPKRSPQAFLSLLMSTPMIMSAPASAGPG
jgi:hypothetical protein